MATRVPKPRKKPDPSAQLLSEKPPAKAQLILDSDSESDSARDEYHSAAEAPQEEELKINEEYAKRFEHNKKREELHRLEEKYGPNSKRTSDDSNSDSEDEDETAVLATIELDQEIAATLNAIRNKDPRVYDGKTTFYSSIPDLDDATPTTSNPQEEKPIFLRDYHRMNLLSTTTTPDEPKTFVQEQSDLKSTVLKEIHAAADDPDSDPDSDSDFLTRKPQPEPDSTTVDLPDPALADSNPEEFLNRFLSSRSWATRASHPAVLSDDSEEEESAEAFEKAYNFRFENPDVAARASLVSYGRDAVSANTVRREDKSVRKIARERKRENREREREEREREKGRLKKLKMEELMGRFKMIREAAGMEGEGSEEVEAEVLERLLEGEWSEKQWEEWMAGRFGEEYYGKSEGKIKKPEFEDDIDIADIVPDFEDDEPPIEDEDEGGVPLGDEDETEKSSKKRKGKKDIQKEDRKKKQKDKDLKRKLEKFVGDNYDFEDQIPAASSNKTRGFRYRETTPEAYGLTPLDILTATDQDLNTFVGLKKLASFRELDKKKKDKKRYGKKKRLREWRKEVFGSEEGVAMPAGWKPSGLAGKERKGEVDIVERAEGEGEKRKKRRKNKS